MAFRMVTINQICRRRRTTRTHALPFRSARPGNYALKLPAVVEHPLDKTSWCARRRLELTAAPRAGVQLYSTILLCEALLCHTTLCYT